MVQVLEAALGAPVFERGAKGVRLTAFGDRVMDHARAIRAQALLLDRNVEGLRDRPRPQLHLAAAPVSPLAPISKAMIDVLEDVPDAHIQVTVRPPDDALKLLQDGTAEMAMVPLGGAEQAKFSRELLYHDAMAIYCASGHPLAGGDLIDVAELQRQRWVLGPPGTLVRTRIEDLFASLGAPPPLSGVEIDDVALRRSMVVQSGFVSAFQSHHVFNEVSAGLIARVPYHWSQEVSPVGLLRVMPHTDLSSRLREAMRRRLREAGMPTATSGQGTLLPLSPSGQKGHLRHDRQSRT
jgi:DNA-binding transcriptional LysR family regulator